MKRPRGGGRTQQLQVKMRLDVLSTSIGLLLRLMDNSTGGLVLNIIVLFTYAHFITL